MMPMMPMMHRFYPNSGLESFHLLVQHVDNRRQSRILTSCRPLRSAIVGVFHQKWATISSGDSDVGVFAAATHHQLYSVLPSHTAPLIYSTKPVTPRQTSGKGPILCSRVIPLFVSKPMFCGFSNY